MAHPYWPLFDLVVRTPLLELRPPDDAMLLQLAEASGDIFDPGETQFKTDWTAEPEPHRQRHSLQWWWRTRAELTPEKWSLPLAVVVDGVPVGVQDLMANHFPQLRSVSTGSWLRRSHRGRGLGVEMRQAVLHLAFDGLGATEAHSAAFDTNPTSIAVSRRVGDEENGEELALRGGTDPAHVWRFRMSRVRYEQLRRDDVTVENLEPCLELLGLAVDLSPLTAEGPSVGDGGPGGIGCRTAVPDSLASAAGRGPADAAGPT